MLVRKLLKLLITVSLVASACQPATDNSGLAPNQIAPQQAQNQMVEVDHSISHRLPTHSPHLKGQISTVNNNDQVNFKINIIPNATQGFSTQALDKTQIRYVKMYVTGIGITGKIWNDNGFIDTTDLNASVQISGIPPGSNRVLTAIAYDVNKVEIPGAQVKGYYSSTASGNIQVEVTWKFVPVANALEKLIENNDLNTLRSFDVNVFQEAIEELIYGSNDRNGTAFLVHPTLLDFEALTKAIQDNPQLNTQGLLDVLKNSQNFLIQPQTLKGILVGLVAGETLEVTSNDPATNTVIKLVATGDNDVFAFNDASPGNWVFTVNNLTRDEVLTTKTAPGGSTIKFMTYDEVVQALIESRDPALVEAAELALQNAQNAQTQAQNTLLDAQKLAADLAIEVEEKFQALQIAQQTYDQAEMTLKNAEKELKIAKKSVTKLTTEANPERIKEAKKELKAAELAVDKAQKELSTLVEQMETLFNKYYKIYSSTLADGLEAPPKAKKPGKKATLLKKADIWQKNLSQLLDYGQTRIDFFNNQIDGINDKVKQAKKEVKIAKNVFDKALKTYKLAAAKEKAHHSRKNAENARKAKEAKEKALKTLKNKELNLESLELKLISQEKILTKEEAVFKKFKNEYKKLMKKVNKSIAVLKEENEIKNQAEDNLKIIEKSVAQAEKALPTAQKKLKKAQKLVDQVSQNRDQALKKLDKAQRQHKTFKKRHAKTLKNVTTSTMALTNAQTVVAEAQRELEMIPFRSAHLEKVKATLEELLNQNRREVL